ncbi:hypothetical protein BMS3Abin04_02025 [bacterium BMS3Abin04]|nr:hypothetical protein BMS3Abin04_02025 [bacterium BMS3Abin04]
MKKIIPFILITILCFFNVKAENSNKYKTHSQKSVLVSVPHSIFNINNISTYIYANGDADIKPDGNSGLFFPKGSNKTIVFESGLVWGANINGQIRVGGSTYSSGLRSGKILTNGSPQDPTDPKARVFRVRPDYKTGDLSSEINDGEGTEEEIRAQYKKDWNEWPADDGAPYDDKNNNGIYEPGIDIPGVPGADQTLWFVANDLDSNQTKSLYGSLPFGVEVQVTVWGYADRYPFSNIIFKKYKLINKSNSNFDDMYFSIWTDPDVGDAANDMSGCDTNLSLMFAYNGQEYDEVYGMTPPAVGFELLQGPIVKSESEDKAIFNNKLIHGYKNLKMSSYYFFVCGGLYGYPPTIGDYNGSLEYYSIMSCPLCWPRGPFMDSTKFPLSGNPLTGEGWVWVDSTLGTSCGDVNHGLVSGPFDMAVGDTQEVVFAEIAALGKDRLNAVRLLKFYSSIIKEKYNNLDNFGSIPRMQVPDDLSYSNFGSYNTIQLQIKKDNDIQAFSENNFSFEGYNLYQFYSDILLEGNAVKIATFDKIDGIKDIRGLLPEWNTGYTTKGVVEQGSDSGIPESFTVDKDYTTNSSLIKGKKYYYGITSYAINSNPNAEIKSIESPIKTVELKFQENVEGPSYGDTLSVTHISGSGDVEIKAIVTNPSQLTGHEYQISFEEIDDTLYWDLTDLDNNNILLSQIPVIFTHHYLRNYIVLNKIPIDGFKIQAVESEGFKKDGDGIIEVAYGGHKLTKDEYDLRGAPYGGNKVWHSPNSEGVNGNNDRYYLSASGSGSISRILRYIDFAQPRDFELRFTENGGLGIYAFEDNKITHVPFELWDIGINTPNDTSDDVRMIPFLHSQDDGTKAEWGWANGTDNYWGFPASDIIYWMDPEGSNGFDNFTNVCTQSGGAGAIYNSTFDNSTSGYWTNFHGGSVYPIGGLTICDYDRDGNPPPPGTTIRFLTNKPITSKDKFTFKTKKVLAKIFPNKFEVFQNYPNPFNPTTTIRFFLPEDGNVKLTVYNMLGQRVKKLLNKKMLAGKYEIPFNGSNLASGIYLYTLKTDKKTEVRKMVLLK